MLFYLLKKTTREKFDKKLDKIVIPGLFGGPHENNIAAAAVALKEADTPAFKKYAKQIVKNAQTLAKELQKLGLACCFRWYGFAFDFSRYLDE